MSVRVVRAAVASMLAAVLLGPVLAGPAPSWAAADPSGLAPRYAAKGWLGVAQTAATASGSDVDGDPSTVNSSRADLTIPPGATVGWAGLHWGGDLASAGQCAVPGGGVMSAPAPDQAGTAQLSIGDSPYQTVNASDVARLSTATGAPAYQAFADITAVLLPYAGHTVTLTLANLQLASGPGCVGGWSLLVVYGYPNGPDKLYAPVYQSVAVFDQLLGTGGSLKLRGLIAPAAGVVTAGATAAVLSGGAPTSVAVDAHQLGGDGSGGYRMSSTALPAGTITAGATTAALTVDGTGDSFTAAVVAIGVGLPITVAMAVTASFAPATVAVGAVAQFTLTVRNDGDVPNAGVVVTAPLPAGVALTSDITTYNPTTGAWTVGTVAPHTTATVTLNVRVNAAGSFSSSAKVSASAVALDKSKPAIASAATIVAQTVPLPTNGDTVNEPAALDQPPAASGGVKLPPGGILFGAGLFGLGLLLLLVILMQRRTD